MRPEAEAEHRQAVKLAPNNPAYLNNLGFSLYLRQRFKEAISVYESAARLAPPTRRVRTNLGLRLRGDRRPARARRASSRWAAREAEAKNNLGFAYERRGDMANAYDLYVRGGAARSQVERARSNLVHAAIVLGRPVPPEAAAPAATPSPKAADDAADAATKIVPADATQKGGEAVKKIETRVVVARVHRDGGFAERLRTRAPQRQLRARPTRRGSRSST